MFYRLRSTTYAYFSHMQAIVSNTGVNFFILSDQKLLSDCESSDLPRSLKISVKCKLPTQIFNEKKLSKTNFHKINLLRRNRFYSLIII